MARYRRNTDEQLSDFRRRFQSQPNKEDGLRLAANLLRINSFQHYREAAERSLVATAHNNQPSTPQDAEAAAVIAYMAAITLDDTANCDWYHAHPYSIVFRDPKTQQQVNRYINVYCDEVPLASVEVSDFDEAQEIKGFLTKLYQDYHFPLPPEMLRLDSAAERITGQKTLVATVYQNKSCKISLNIDDQPAFQFGGGSPWPTYKWKTGEKPIRMRPLSDEDYTLVDNDYSYGQVLKNYDYDGLPDFCKPSDIEGVPSHVMASIVTRHHVRYIDGDGWEDFYAPFAKIYVGYLPELYLQITERHWDWTPKLYTNVCGQTPEVAARNQQRHDEGLAHYQAYEREPCEEAGISAPEDERRSRCGNCHNELTPVLSHPRILVLHPDAPVGTMPPPPYLNETLTILQKVFDNRIHGDTGSVLGGQDLSVALGKETYGPEPPEE